MADLISINGGKQNTTDETNTIPVNDYVITTMSGRELFGTGFCIFTAAHIAIMRDDGEGAVPIIVLPLSNVDTCEMIHEDEDEDAPF